MTEHRLTATQLIPRPVDEVVPFFADPRNLGRLTPASMGFEFLTDDFAMREGLDIRYRIRPLFGIPATWGTTITEADPPHGFVDIQSKGPYRMWEHRHRFEPVEGGTLVHDDIRFRLPLGPLGDLAQRLVVRRELEWIFRYRAAAVRSIFAPAGPATGRTIAVAGGSGFVGGAIALELHRRGHHVVVLSRDDGLRTSPLPDAIEVRRADVSTGDGLADALAGVDAVVIALAFENSPIEAPRRHQTFLEVDAAGTERVVAAAAAAGVPRVVYLSGAGAAPDAQRPWFRTKWRAEEAVRGSGMTYTIVRPTWIYGPRDVALNRFLGFARQLLMVPMTNLGRQRLAPVFVDDVGRLVADALVSDAAADQVFELGGPEALSMREIIATALRVAGIRRLIVPGPTPLIKLAAIPLSWLPRPILTPAAVDFINQPAVVDTRPLLERMPRRLTRLEEGLATYLGPVATDASLLIDGRVAVRGAGLPDR
jgi:NADH dehydrogenase